jgi:hypothetical protein
VTRSLLKEASSEGAKERREERLFDAGRAPTLDDVVSRISQSLKVRGNSVCLVCGATFVRDAENSAAGTAECSSCGSRLE